MEVIAVGISACSPNDSYVRPHRSLRATHRQGAKVQSMPVPATSSAVARATACASPGSRLAPSPMLCGKMVAPRTLLCPCTASMPYMTGMPRGVACAALWKPSYMSAHPVGVLSAGAEPPPERIDPMRYAVMSCGLVSAARSTCASWPSLSSRVIRPSRSATRAGTGCAGSW
jgi:hypothetical protein